MAGIYPEDFKITHKTSDKIREAKGLASKTYLNIAGNVESGLGSNHYNGDFVGISQSGIDAFKAALSDYIIAVQDILKDFKEDVEVDNAFKGDVGNAAKDFIKAMKQMLMSYASTMLNEKKEIDEILASYKRAASIIGSAVSKDADSIRKTAGRINLDPSKN